MAQVYLRLVFDETPTEEQQKLIISKLLSDMDNICPGQDKKISSGIGSWWVMVWCVVTGVGLWLFGESASWALNKTLDKIFEEADRGRKKMKLQSSSENEGIQPSTLLSSTGNEELQRKIAQISERFKALEAIKEKTGAKEIIYFEWSEGSQKGRALRVSGESGSMKCHMYQTDSKEDFDSYTKDSY